MGTPSKNSSKKSQTTTAPSKRNPVSPKTQCPDTEYPREQMHLLLDENHEQITLGQLRDIEGPLANLPIATFDKPTLQAIIQEHQDLVGGTENWHIRQTKYHNNRWTTDTPDHGDPNTYCQCQHTMLNAGICQECHKPAKDGLADPARTDL